MERCEYCGAEFDDEGPLLEHFAEVHREDLGPIDERRVARHVDGTGRSLPTGPLVLGGVIVAAVLLMAFVVFGMVGGTTINDIEVAQAPGAIQSAHEHGRMTVTIDGERIDFRRPRYQAPGGRYADRKFHFEDGNGRVWHTHASGVTLEYAMATLGIEVERNAVVVDGETYVDGDGTNVTVTVDGTTVDPSSYVLDGVATPTGEGGDVVRIEVQTGG